MRSTHVRRPLTETPLAAPPIPDGLTGFGLTEFMFLACVSDTPQTAISREFLGIERPSDDVMLMGRSGC